jgi:hypothetical protein
MIECVAGDAERGKNLLSGCFTFALFLFVMTPGKATA